MSYKENAEIPEVMEAMGKKKEKYSPDWRTAIIDRLRKSTEEEALNPKPKKSMKDVLDPNKRPGMEGL